MEPFLPQKLTHAQRLELVRILTSMPLSTDEYSLQNVANMTDEELVTEWKKCCGYTI